MHIKVIRILVYVIMALSSIIAIAKPIKNFSEMQEKEYDEICKKYKI